MKAAEKYEDSYLYKLRHTASHVLALAAKEWDPKVKLAIGPPIEDGFYYDFEFSKEISSNLLDELETKMKQIIKRNLPIQRKQLKRAKAIEVARQEEQDYKLELIHDLKDDKLSFYGIGDFWDLCKGPHVKSTGEIKAYKLLSIAGAYWRGDERNPMLTRIYGTAFTSGEELKRHLAKLEEAKAYDHRKLGREMKIFTILPEIGSGLPVWLPRGATLYKLLEDYVRNLEIEAGYEHVITSELGKSELYETSGHLDHYADSMYPPIDIDNETFYLRPMNCPHHIYIYANNLQSYRSLPVRIAEFGEVFRYEKSGELSGLQRVRAFTVNDAHIFCREDQIKTEFKNTVALILHLYKKLEIQAYWFRLSLHDKTNKAKYGGSIGIWEKSEDYLRQALKEMGIEFAEAKDEAAFYGPKLDVQVKNIHGKEETLSTVQLDFYLPEKFDIEFVGEDGRKKRPVMIHRAIMGSMERFIGIYIEKTGGEFPLWLSPVQIKIIPVSQKQESQALKIVNELRREGIRVELDSSNKTLGKRIRQSELEKIPLVAVIGEQEIASGKLTLRRRKTPEKFTVSIEELIKEIRR